MFISHVNDDPESDSVLTEVCSVLKRDGFDILLDRHRLQAGSAWRREIYAWLGLCHAAVVLISLRAVFDEAKRWVARETALLVWRQALDPSLHIVPVLLPAVQPADLDKGPFADLQLREIQFLVLDDDLSATAEAICASLAVHCRSAALRPLDEVTRQVTTRLAGIDTQTLHQAAKMLSVDLGDWRPSDDARLDVAPGLLCAPLEEAAQVVDYLVAYMPGSKRADLVGITRILAANWVYPEAARWLAHEAPHGHAAILNAGTQFAAEACVQRACGRPPPTRWQIIPLTGGITGEAAEEELRAEVEAALEHAIPLPPDAFGADPKVRRRRLLERRHQKGEPIFLPHPHAVGSDLVATHPH